MERNKEEETGTSTEDKGKMHAAGTGKKNKKARTVNIQKAVERMNSLEEPVETKHSSSTEVKIAGNVSSIATMSQSELVRLAFAAPSQVEIDDEFEKEKVRK
jgi:hypothetical protein